MSFSESAIMTLANFSPHGVDTIVKKLAQSKTIYLHIQKLAQQTLSSVDKLDRILVVSDTNIGDAVVIQSVIRILKYYFPRCAIDYVYQQKAQSLIENNPYIDHSLPVFINSDFTSHQNNNALDDVVTENSYDLILNLYPFFSNGALTDFQCPILTPFKLVADIVKTNCSRSGSPNVLYQLNKYINDMAYFLPDKFRFSKKRFAFSGNTIYLNDDVFIKTDRMMQHLNIHLDAKFVLINPDTSSRYTKIPVKLQVGIVRQLLLLDDFDVIILGPGFTFNNIEHEISHQIQLSLRKNKLFVLPNDITLEEYTGLIDRSQIFITGDTAQLHIAAAFKVCLGSEHHFRNKTAIIDLFGATNSKIYGYDSFSKLHIPANQKAPSKVFEGNPDCKNLSCIHKTRKKCTEVRCFDGIKSKHIIDYIKNYLLIV